MSSVKSCPFASPPTIQIALRGGSPASEARAACAFVAFESSTHVRSAAWAMTARRCPAGRKDAQPRLHGLGLDAVRARESGSGQRIDTTAAADGWGP